eukprot:9470184-Pyramimonas_sp.AAC.1
MRHCLTPPRCHAGVIYAFVAWVELTSNTEEIYGVNRVFMVINASLAREITNPDRTSVRITRRRSTFISVRLIVGLCLDSKTYRNLLKIFRDLWRILNAREWVDNQLLSRAWSRSSKSTGRPYNISKVDDTFQSGSNPNGG